MIDIQQLIEADRNLLFLNITYSKIIAAGTQVTVLVTTHIKPSQNKE